MAVTVNQDRVSISMKLHTGTSETGVKQTKSVSLGSLKTTAFTAEDNQKAMNIVNLLNPCFAYNMLETKQTITNTLDEE